jgi:hypothetical protein
VTSLTKLYNGDIVSGSDDSNTKIWNSNNENIKNDIKQSYKLG